MDKDLEASPLLFPLHDRSAQELIAALGQGITVVDENGRFEYVNPAYARMVGRSLTTLRALTPEDVTHPDDLPRLTEARRQRLTGQTTSYETRLLRPDGTIVYAHITGVPRLQDDEIVGSLTIVNDITALKQAEEAYHTLVENSLQGLLIFQDFRVVFANSRIKDISGFTPQEIMALPPGEFLSRIYEPDRERVSSHLTAHLAHKNALPRMEFRVWHKSGEIRWVESHARDIVYRGRPAIQIAVLNITDRKKAVQALQASEEKHRRLLNSIQSPVVALTPEMKILYCNEAYSDFVGKSISELVDRDLLTLFPDFAETQSFAAYQKALETGEVQEVASKMRQWYWQVRIHPAPWGIIAIADDITEHKKAENALRESERQVQLLFADAQRQAQELALLDKVQTALARELDLDTIFHTVVEAIAGTFGYTRVNLYLLQGSQLVLQHQVGYAQVLSEIPLTEGINGRVARTGAPILLKNVRTDPDFLAVSDDSESEICVPLFDQETAVGTLNVESKTGRSLTEKDLQLIMALSESINIAIYRARLYAEVQQGRQQLQMVITNAPIILWALDADGKFTYCHGKGLESLGLQGDQIVGMSLFDVFGLLVPELVHLFEQALMGEETETAVTIAGTPFIARYAPIRNDTGEVTGVTGVALDITAQAKAEASLRASEERYRLVVNSVGDVIFQIDVEGKWQFLNNAWTEIIGYPVAESLGANFLDYVHPADRAKNTAEFLPLIEKKKDFCRHQVRYLTQAGSYRWLEVHARRIEDEEGRIWGISGLLRDVTERIQREHELESFATVTRALRQAKKRGQMLTIILDRALDLLQARGALFIMHSNADENRGQIELGRGDWQKLSGKMLRSEGETSAFAIENGDVFINKDVTSVLPPEMAAYIEPHFAVMAAPVRSKDALVGDIWVGRQQPFSANDAQSLQTIAEITAAALDRAWVLETLEQQVADRTQELVVANERLLELDQLKTKFIDDVSHELRTPATSISLFLDLLKRGPEAKQDFYLTMLRESSQRLNQLIESILQFAHLTETAVAQEPTIVNLNEMLANIIKQNQARAAKAGLQLSFNANDNLPPVYGIADLLRQAVNYLLDNAFKYTLGGSVTISTNLDKNRQMACVEIKDTGIGIEMAEQKRVFDRFYRGQHVSQLTTPGSGLGLSLVQQIVTRHKGAIDIVSEQGSGTTVCVCLPLADTQQSLGR